jgi:hypothetical protein
VDRPPPNPVIAALSALCVLATGLYGAAFWIGRDRGPPREAIASAAKIVRGEHRPGDLIFLVPFYATMAREYLGDLHPLAVRDPLAEDFEVHPRAWVFGLFGEAEKLRPAFERAGFALSKSDTSIPGVVVDLWDTRARYEVRYAFLDHLRSAKVHHERDTNKTACAAWSDLNGQGGPFGRWSCPQDSEWFYVAPEWHRMGDHLRFCFWAHPPNQGRLVITFADVPLTGHLYGRAGHTLNSSRNARAPVHLDVQIGELHPQRFTFELEDTDRPFVLQTPQTGTATVSFAVSTPDAGTNHFCFSADMRSAR